VTKPLTSQEVLGAVSQALEGGGWPEQEPE
jgi:hypothetical protein